MDSSRNCLFPCFHLPQPSLFCPGPLLNNFIHDALAGGPIKVGRVFTPLRSYIYAADLAVFWRTVLFSCRVGKTYNVGSDEAVSIAELAAVTARLIEPAVAAIV